MVYTPFEIEFHTPPSTNAPQPQKQQCEPVMPTRGLLAEPIRSGRTAWNHLGQFRFIAPFHRRFGTEQ